MTYIEEARRLTIDYLQRDRDNMQRMGAIRMYLQRNGSNSLKLRVSNVNWPSQFRQLLQQEWYDTFAVEGRNVILIDANPRRMVTAARAGANVSRREVETARKTIANQQIRQSVAEKEAEAQPLWPEMYRLITERDAADWFEFVEETIASLATNRKVKSTYGTAQEGDFEHPLAVIREELSKVRDRDVHSLVPSEVQNMWEQLVDVYVECELNNSPQWGAWRIKTPAQSDEFDINGAPCTLIVPAEGLTNIHKYSRVPAKMEWDVLPVEQEGVKFYMAVASVKEVDAACMVPQLPNILNCLETAERVNNPEKAQNQWQRQLNVNRALAIKNFTSNNQNVIANTPILFVAKEEFVQFEGRKMYIDMHWLERVGAGEYRDVCNDMVDHRPIWLIDGQHRIRGSARSPRGMNLQVPLIIFPADFQMMRAAKVFAEINTLQEGLGELHTLFMQHRFNIPSPKAKRDFGLDEDGNPANDNSRANHLSYEMAAAFCSEDSNPLYKRIRFLEQNDAIIPVIKANQWLDFSRTWFTEIYHERSGYTTEMMHQEIRNYFQAFCAICKRGYASRPGLRLPPDFSGPKSVIEKISNFPVLLRVFKAVRTKAEFLAPVTQGEVITYSTFMGAIRPWKNVDWHDEELERFLQGGGESGRTHLRVWMEDALKSDSAHARYIVHTDQISSEPGQGLFAKPENPRIIVDGDNWIHRRGQKLVFKSERPINAFATCTWDIYSGEDHHEKKINTKADTSTGMAELQLGYEDWMRQARQIIVRASWSNKAQGNGEATVTLRP